MPAEIISIGLTATLSEYDKLKMFGDKTFQKSFMENLLEEGQQQLQRYAALRDQGYQIDHVELIETHRGKELFFLLYLPGEKPGASESFDSGIDPLPAPYDTGYNDDIPF